MGLSSATQVYGPLGNNNPDVEDCSWLVTYDGSGVPSIVSGLGAKALVDDGTGLFTLTTSFPWKYIVGFSHGGFAAAAAGFKAELVPASIDSANHKFQVRLTNPAGAAADPANGAGMYINLKFQRSGAPRTG